MTLSWKLGLGSFLAMGGAILTSNYAFAQITPDTTLPTNSRVTPLDNLGFPVDRIDDGTIRSTNLFHSFLEFNVNEGRGAYFTNPAGIENILSRVTGGNCSDIQGTLGVLGSANLFLINPNGIIFGPNSSLDVRGSFVGTTANALRLGNTGLFSASEPATSNLLTVSPSALFFNAVAAQGVVNQSQAQSLSGETNSLGGPVGLQVPTGQTLAIVGGNVLLEGGNLTAAGGQIELGSVAGVGEVGLSQSGNSLVLGYDSVDAFGNIRLEGGAFVDVSGAGGGNLQIQGAQLEMTQGSLIFADTLGSEDGGEVLVRTTEAIALRDGSQITADVGGSGTGGDLTIATEQLTLQDGAQVSASTFGTGASGTLSVTADLVELIGTAANGQRSGLSAQTVGDGNAGNLTIATERLTVQDGAQVSASTFGTGDGGTLSVTADAVEVIGESADGQQLSSLTAQANGDADTLDGNAGNLTIATGRLTVQDGAQVGAGTFGTGAGGNLNVTADVVEVIGTSANGQFPSGLFTRTVGDGNAGNLTIATGQLTVRDGAQVSASTLSTGASGTLSVTADAVEVIGESADGRIRSGLFAQTAGDGDAGDLTIATGQLTVRDGAVVSAGTGGTGDGGTLSVTADVVELIGTLADGQFPSGLFAQTVGDGNAGNLTIATGQLTVRDGAEVNVSSIGSGNAGNLDVAARSIQLDNQAFLSSNTVAGQGNIDLRSEDLVLRRGSNITTDATGTETGGNITIDTDLLVALENSDIRATAEEASGGQVIIDAQGIIGTEFREDLTSQSDITASSNLGPQFSGTVEINTPDVELQGSLTPPSANFVSPEQVVAGSCLARRNVEQGSFTVTGTGGLPRSPYEAISGQFTVAGVQPIQGNSPVSSQAAIVESAPWKRGDPIREAQGMVVTADGRTIVGTTPQLVALARADDLVCHPNQRFDDVGQG